MICFWKDERLCLEPENIQERVALATLHDVFRAGLKPRPLNEKEQAIFDAIKADIGVSESESLT
jgi:hypothetical protein